MNSNSEQGGRSRKWLIIGLAVVAIAVVASVFFFLIPSPSPEEVARKWAADNVDAAGEGLAEFVLDSLGQEGIQAMVLKELGGEWIEDRINEHLAWEFSSAKPDGNGNHIVVATASVDFQVDQPPVSGNIRASLPFSLVISGRNVVEENIVLADAGFDAKLEGIGMELNPANIEEGIEKAEEAAEEAADKLKGLLGN